MTTENLSTTRPTAERGWGLTLRIATVLTLASIALFASSGVSEGSVRVWVRATARASIALFLMAFVARPLHQLARSAVSSWLLANRRYLGVAAAYAQLLHGISLVWLFTAFVKYEPDLTGLVGGGLGFALTNWGNIPFAFEKLGIGHQVLYVGIQAALFGVLGLRLVARLRRRKNA